jgi:hypothetical protein
MDYQDILSTEDCVLDALDKFLGNQVKITDKVKKDINSCSIEFKDNGFVLSASGEDEDGEWVSCDLVFTDIKELFANLKEIAALKGLK